MKRIIICAAQVPFERGGAEAHVEGLRRALLARGHAVDVIALPFKWYPRPALLASCLAWRLLDLSEVNGRPVDMVIATKFPSYVVRHPNKVVWLIHQFRQVYDWYGTPLSDFGSSPEDVRIRQMIFEIDQRTLGEARRLFANARNTANRLQRFNGLTAAPLYPPSLYEGRLRCDGYNDSILYLGRLDKAKRVELLVKAMAHAPAGVRCLIAGTGQEGEPLAKLARRLRLGERVRFLGWVDDETLVQLYAQCFAVCYTPLDEDFGYVALEAFQSKKPVITATDSGGVLEFVEDGVTGCVCPPDPLSLAAQIARLFSDKALCERMGTAGYQRVRHIRWDSTVQRLLDL